MRGKTPSAGSEYIMDLCLAKKSTSGGPEGFARMGNPVHGSRWRNLVQGMSTMVTKLE